MIHTEAVTAATAVLYIKGQVERFDEIRIRAVYEDEKIRVTGVLALDYVQNRDYVQITVEIRKAPDLNDKRAAIFGLRPKENDEWSYVLIADDNMYFLRPGRWEKYIDRIVNEHNRRANELMKLHNQPIEDEALFPEVG